LLTRSKSTSASLFAACRLPCSWSLQRPGCDYSAWSKPYRYESSTRHTCSGAEVYEPELKKDPHL
jgi:hypothetical protein